jgi:predicted nucleic acid-binding protein
VSYLIDTNVLSEIRKGSRAHKQVLAWWHSTNESDLFLSVIVIGEIYRGIEKLLPVDPRQANVFLDWIQEVVKAFQGRILNVDLKSAKIWGKLTNNRTLPLSDGLLAATAISRNLTLVTRNTRDIHDTGVRYLNPWAS